MISQEIVAILTKALEEVGVQNPLPLLERPADLIHGDYTSNAALAYAKEVSTNPRELGEGLAAALRAAAIPGIANVTTAGPGFVNVSLSDDYFRKTIEEILIAGKAYGRGHALVGTRVMIEYTDPNPFKEFHIGHFMPNMVGESLSRLIEFSGAEVKRVNYQGDIGMHVAMALYGMARKGTVLPKEVSLLEQVQFLGQAYARGATAYKEEEEAKKEIVAINKQIYDAVPGPMHDLYKLGRSWSLEYFETIYKKLGTKFDYYVFESDVWAFAKRTVEENVSTGVFERSEGAIIFRGESYGLHTRVFVNSAGYPIYEGKDLGLAKVKHDLWPYDLSVIVTGNEIDAYFKVLLKAMELVFPDLAAKTKHISHGMLRLPTGKMSSRTGNIISAVELIGTVRQSVEEIAKDRRIEDPDLLEQIAIGAIKYSVLRQALGRDIIFDFQKSISFEGDSGPYLQYAHARASSVLAKAAGLDVAPSTSSYVPGGRTIEQLLERFPDIAARAGREHAPQYVATYLIDLAGAFNAYYAAHHILDGSPEASYKLALAAATRTVLASGLWLLGIAAPEEM
jgi:arginyl-tRNA synthetase